MRFGVRKLRAGWALGPGRFLALALHSLAARVRPAKRRGTEEARDFVVGVIAAAGSIKRSDGAAGHLRVSQTLDDLGREVVAILRPGTSDLAVWNQVVLKREYAPVVRVLKEWVGAGPETILDLGANIGLTTVFLGAVYPAAQIVAVEPDPSSFELLQRNAQLLGTRVKTVRAAFWARDEHLSWTAKPFRDGRDWARAVEASDGAHGEPLAVITPEAALAQLGVQRADLAKVDIEGAEAAFFATEDGTDALLGMADVLAIELHLESLDPLDVAMAFDRRGFVTVSAGDYLIAVRRERIAASGYASSAST